jgi:hypothetical protein
MGIRVKVLLVVAGVIFALFVVRSIRSSSIRPTFAWLWIGIVCFLVSIPFFEAFYKWLSVSVLQVLDARHVIYMPLIGFLLLYVFYVTIVLSRLSDRVQELITHTAILEHQFRTWRADVENRKDTGGGRT